MAEKFLMKNETTGQMKPTFIGYSWTMLLFNIFAPLFRGDFITFFSLIGFNLIVYSISPNIIFWSYVSFLPGFIYSFLWNKEYTKRLIKKGFTFAEDDDKNKYASLKLNNPNKAGYIFCAIFCALDLIAAFQAVGNRSSSLNNIFENSADSTYNSATYKIDRNNISNLSPHDKNLISLFKVPSEYTDLQREDMLTKIKGKIVAWNLPVYEISQEQNNIYKVITQSSPNLVGTVIYLEANRPNEKDYLLGLKTGSNIDIIGVLTGETFLRNLIIRPAELNINTDVQYGKVDSDKESLNKSNKPLRFDHCKRLDGVVPLICGNIPLKGYRPGECISAMMEDYEQVCKKMRKGKEYYFEYKIMREDFEGEPCEPYENITNIYLNK